MLGRRKPTTTPAAEPTHDGEPAEQLADAETALSNLSDELTEVGQKLGEHARQRQEILSGDGDLAQIVELDRADYQLNLRHEQIQHRLPALQAAVQAARVAVHEAAWQTFRPQIQATELQLAASIGSLYHELRLAKDVHAAAHRAGFGRRLGEFLAIPPDAPLNDYSLREYARHAGREQLPTPPVTDFTTAARDQTSMLSADPLFTPKPPDFAAIRNLDPQAAPRAVRILHNAQTSNLHIGLNQVFAGKEHVLPAKAAATLVTMGVATYLDSEEAVEALTAVA